MERRGQSALADGAVTACRLGRMAMTASAFDTLATVRKLKAAGVAGAQVEAYAEATTSAVHSGRNDLATKADLKVEIAAAEKRMLLAGIALAGIIFALVKLLP